MPWLGGFVMGAVCAWAFCLVYAFVVRPWHMRWGATDDEADRPLAGDDLVTCPRALATHGVTIRARAAEIWPWLVQIGQGRGGFYSYDWLENLFGCDIHNVDRIVPDWQALAEGDGIRLHPRAEPLTVVKIDPRRALVICGGRDLQPGMGRDATFLKLHRLKAYSWAFVLDERADGTTRLLARVRADWEGGLINFCRYRLFLEPAHSIMQRKMNLGLRRCVEAPPRLAAAGPLGP